MLLGGSRGDSHCHPARRMTRPPSRAVQAAWVINSGRAGVKAVARLSRSAGLGDANNVGVRAFAVAALALAALALPQVAAAHATLVRSSPASGAALAVAPRAARFVFDDVVRPASGIKAVRSDGTPVQAGKPHVVGGKTLVVPLQTLSTGDYTVLWRVISDDGHTEAGVITFSVGTGAPPGVAVLNASAGVGAREVIARWLFFAGLLVAAGGAVFRLAVAEARVGVLVPAFVACFLGATALLPHQGSFASRFAAAYAVAAIVSALGAAAAAVAFVEPLAAWPAWIIALVLLPLPSVAGHALDPGRPRIELAVDVLHLTAAAVWTGGLVQLALALRASEERPRLVRRFSAVALVSVLVLSATGVLRAIGELSAVSQLWSTGYGRLLIIKTALLGLLVALGWLNRYRLIPRSDTAGLRRSVRVELLLLAGLVVAVAVLTDSRPGRDHAVARAAPAPPATGAPPLPSAEAVVVAQEAGDYAVALAAEPQRLRVTVLGQDGLGANGLRVAIDGTEAMPCGAGCYGQPGPHGRTVAVAIGSRRVVFRLPRTAPAAAGLVARTTNVFRRLSSVTYVERLASSPRNRLVTTFTLEAPNRLHYRIHGGSAATVIGTRRWDGCTESQTTTLPQPAPIWGTPVTNAHLLRRSGNRVLVSFLNPSVPAWFEVWLDRRTLRPTELDMTAAAHFMHHTYSGYDAPRRVFPPKC
jgi:copper transport protein